jgi:hypothetical protein
MFLSSWKVFARTTAYTMVRVEDFNLPEVNYYSVTFIHIAACTYIRLSCSMYYYNTYPFDTMYSFFVIHEATTTLHYNERQPLYCCLFLKPNILPTSMR